MKAHLPIAEESEKNSRTGPKIAYHQALASWFLLPDGSIHNVQTANSLDFLIFILIASKQKRVRLNRRELIDMLDGDDSDLTRWFVLNEMLQFKCDVSLFDNMEEAQVASSHAATCQVV